ncbi:MAG TPA: MBG domain-containing protein, partial [Rhizomicrobium sp.]
KPIALVATASSGLAVSFSVISGPAKVSGSTLTLTGVGTVVVAAKQAGNAVYAAAPEAKQSLVVEKGVQSIAFAPLASPVTYGVKPIELSATSSSGLAVTFKLVSGPAKLSGHTLTITGAGKVEVEATQGGNADYAAATAITHGLDIEKAGLSVKANNLSMAQGAAVPPLTYRFVGFVNGDTPTDATTGKPALSTTATSKSPAGTYVITVKAGTLVAKSYSFTFVSGALTVTQ